jgi:hypothetical protein
MWVLVAMVGGIYTGAKCPHISKPIVEYGDKIVVETKRLWKIFGNTKR